MSAQPIYDDIKEVGVDYITATSRQNNPSSSFCSFANWMVSEEVSRGCKDSAWRSTGYHGRHAGHVAFGVSNQGSIIRASSQCARDYWEQLLNLSDNVTRLDVQVTLRPRQGTQPVLSSHHKQLKQAPRYRGKEAQFKVWYGPAGPEAAVLGKRVSDRFGRVYDKGLESELPEYHGYLRYELELKRHVALDTARRLDASSSPEATIAGMVYSFMTNRGLRLGEAWSTLFKPADCAGPQVRQCSIMTGEAEVHKEVVRSLRWMRNSVYPAVKRLIDAGYEAELLRALGLSAGPSVPAAVISGTWGQFEKWR